MRFSAGLQCQGLKSLRENRDTLRAIPRPTKPTISHPARRHIQARRTTHCCPAGRVPDRHGDVLLAVHHVGASAWLLTLRRWLLWSMLVTNQGLGCRVT